MNPLPAADRIPAGFPRHVAINACLALMLLAWHRPAAASSFIDYGGFGKYKLSPANGGGCVSAVIGTTLPGKNFNVVVNYAGRQFTDKAEFNKAYFGFTTLDKKHDIAQTAFRASAVMLCLKPGDYDIIGIEMSRMTSTQPIRMPFTVIAGKNRYLGRLIFHRDAARALSCGSIAADGVEIQDQFTLDAPLIAKLKGAAAPEPAVLDATRGEPYFYRCGES